MGGRNAGFGGDGDLLSDAAVAATRADPRFRAAAEAFAAGALGDYDAQDGATRWLMNDLGRASLYFGAVILDTTGDGLTPAGLCASASATGVASRGRAIAFLQYAQSRGLLVAAAEPQPWSRRRLALTPAFLTPVRRRLRACFEAAALVAPEVAEALPVLQTDRGLQTAVAAAAFLGATRPELSHNPGGPLRQVFIARDAGTRILHQLLLSQPAQRARLLEVAPLSRADLARRHRVSRTHVNRMLADAQAAGALSLPTPDRVVFTPAFSVEVEAYYAGQIQVMRQIATSLAAARDLSAA